MKRRLFNEDHNIFRDAFRKFMEKEVIPFHEQWEKDGMVCRDLWTKSGEAGLLCAQLPDSFSGPI